jgi:hypothetical protein
MISRTTVATFNVSLSDKLRTCTDRHISEFPIVSDVAARGAAHFPRLSAVPMVAGVEGLDAVQLSMTALVR